MQQETAQGPPNSYLSVVSDASINVLCPLTMHGTEAHPQLLWDQITAGNQPSTHLHQRIIITRQYLQDLISERVNKVRVD